MNVWRSAIAKLRIVPIGLAMFWPAMSGGAAGSTSAEGGSLPWRTLSAITSGWSAVRCRYRQIWPFAMRLQTPVLVYSKQIGSLLVPWLYGLEVSPLLMMVMPEVLTTASPPPAPAPGPSSPAGVVAPWW